MTAHTALKELTAGQLHISFSQIWTWLNCGLKFRFQYVEGIPAEHVSINLLFGSAIHKALERYYLDIMTTGEGPDFSVVQAVFNEHLRSDVLNPSATILFSSTLPDLETCIEMGRHMLEKSCSADGGCHSNHTIKGVEVPIAAPVYDDNGTRKDMLLVGVIDLLLEDRNQHPVPVDHKTSRYSKKQEDADEDLQMSAYSYLLAANKYIFPTAPVTCRFHVIKKLKTPKVEVVDTLRTAAHRKRFARIVSGVMDAIEHRIFLPNRSWLCKDCSYSNTCKKW